MKQIRVEPPAALTLGELIAAVMDVAGDEREGLAVVANLLRSGAIRRRYPQRARCYPG
jgi:hypothetical protein